MNRLEDVSKCKFLNRRYGQDRRFMFRSMLLVALISTLVTPAHSWGNNNQNSGEPDMSAYAASYSRDWLYDSSAISLQVDGCVWSNVVNSGGNSQDGNDLGCRENESEDGTTYWYQMANCKRANVAYSLYAASSGGSVACKSQTFKESLVTLNGLAEFIYYLKNYDQNNYPFSDNGGDDDGNGYGPGNLPYCEYNNGYYLSVGCGDDGSFTIDQFSDAYCTLRVGTFSYLKSLNKKLKQTYKKCASVYSARNGDDAQYSLPAMLTPYSEGCSSLDSSLCVDDASMVNSRSSAGERFWRNARKRTKPNSNTTSATRLKYVCGTLLLIASFILFTGILFTNRRKRRALMQRKFRQSSSRRAMKRSGSRSRRSKSRSKRDSGGGESSRRSSSRARRSASRSTHNMTPDDTRGVFT